jgi:fibronectin type 3 domain-containing protein
VNRFSVDISWEYPVRESIYNIYRSADPYSQFELIATTSNLYYTDTNISGSKKYFYKITAENTFR